MKKTKKFSAAVLTIITLIATVLTIWCAVANTVTSVGHICILAAPAVITAWICWLFHHYHAPYTPKREIAFSALLPVIAFSILGAIALIATDINGIGLYVICGLFVLPCAIMLWKESVKGTKGSHCIYALRLITIGWVAAWLYEGISTLCSIPEYIANFGKAYFALSLIYFFASLIGAMGSRK